MKKQIIQVISALILFIIGLSVKFENIWINRAIYLISYAIVGAEIVIEAIKNIFKGEVFDEHFLMAVATIGAIAIGEYPEAVAVMSFYQIGEIFQDYAVDKSKKSITKLMDIRPDYANVKREDKILKVKPEEVKINEIIVVKPGEKIPLDGIVIDGKSMLDTSSLTGESLPRNVEKNDEILSGSINQNGTLSIKVTKEYGESTVHKILDLVENATDKKAKTETFVNKASSIYTPIVIGLAAIVAIFLPLFTDIPYTGNNGSIYRALIFLVISCPCSIAISVPLSYFSGIGKSSKEGILIKGSDYIDAIKDIKEIVFDKTGTLTKGEFEITKIDTFENYTEQEVLKYAAMGEKYSNHPIAKSIMKANKEEVAEVQEFKEIAGKGLSYQYNGETVLVGNSVLVEANDTNEEGATKIYVKINDKLAGIIYLGDTVKDGVVETIKELKALGIKTNMFTGDNKQIAEKTGKETGTGTNKSILITMITTYGLTPGGYADDIHCQVTMKDLFRF